MSFSALDPLPTAPQRNDDPETFIARADAWVAQMEIFTGQLNVFIAELETAAALIAAAPEYADPGLVALTGNTPAADRVPYYTGSGTSALATLTSVARTLIAQATQGDMRTTGLGMTANGSSLVSAADYAAMRALLDLEAGTDFLTPAALAAAYQPLDSDLTSIAALTTTAFGRSFLALADAAAGRALISAGQAPAVTFGANTVSLTLATSTGDTLLIQGGSGSIGANSTATISFPTGYSTAPVAIVSGGASDTGREGDVHITAAASTSGIGISNSTDTTCAYTWFAIGKG